MNKIVSILHFIALFLPDYLLRYYEREIICFQYLNWVRARDNLDNLVHICWWERTRVLSIFSNGPCFHDKIFHGLAIKRLNLVWIVEAIDRHMSLPQNILRTLWGICVLHGAPNGSGSRVVREILKGHYNRDYGNRWYPAFVCTDCILELQVAKFCRISILFPFFSKNHLIWYL